MPTRDCPRSHCPIAFSLDILGDRWTLVVLRDLVINRKRLFRELLEAEEGIATNILTQRLRRLEAAGIVTRTVMTRNAANPAAAEAAVGAFTAKIKPFSIIGLLATVVLLFGFQGEVILSQPLVIGLIAIPLLIQSYGIFAIAYWAAKAWRVPHNVAAPCAMIGTSNFFELAVAVAIGPFGLNSIAALVTVVGVLVEVPVMLSLVWFANRTTHWFPAEETAIRAQKTREQT